MGTRVEVIQKVKDFTLSKHTNVKSGKKHYSIILTTWAREANLEELRNLIDPLRNRGSKYGCKWKFKSRIEAESMLMMAILKW